MKAMMMMERVNLTMMILRTIIPMLLLLLIMVPMFLPAMRFRYLEKNKL